MQNIPVINHETVIVLDTTDVVKIRMAINSMRGELKNLDDNLSHIMSRDNTKSTLTQLTTSANVITSTLNNR